MKTWNSYFASFWKGVTKKKLPKLTPAGMAAYHKRWAAEFRSIADQKTGNKRHEEYWRRVANQHDELARKYNTNG